MEPYARALLRFVHAAVVGRQKVEAFAVGTRLPRASRRQLGSRDPDIAIRQAADEVVDWSGGTRLGEGLRAFNDMWGQRGMARERSWWSSPMVGIVVTPTFWANRCNACTVSPTRSCGVNPLKVTPGYAPLARGMAAALPHIDVFVEGHSIDAMEELARVISASNRPGTLTS